jgi:RimJ/RimL family protein N-acetyltransferase
MIVRKWEPGDTQNLLLQPSQSYMNAYLDNLNIEPLAETGMAWVGEEDGKILAIAGIAPQWENRAVAWALVSTLAGHRFLAIHRAVESFLDNCRFRRVEATVDIGFQPGHRWMKMLGFKPEGYMEAYRPDGADQILYARVRK